MYQMEIADPVYDESIDMVRIDMPYINFIQGIRLHGHKSGYHYKYNGQGLIIE